MGKGSGACDRPGISLSVTDGEETELNLSAAVASVSEIDTTLELQRIDHYWWTKDERATFQKRKEGWEAYAISAPVHKAFEEYGITSTIEGEHIYFPSLKAARQAVTDVSLEAGLNVDTRLTKGKYVSYKIGGFPLSIRKNHDHWQVYELSSALPQNLEKHFNSTEEFHSAWYTTGIAFAYYPTRKAAHQAVINWLSQTITKGK